MGVESYVPNEKSLRDALEQGGDGYRAGAARYAWWPSLSPQPPSSPALRERKGEYEQVLPTPLLPISKVGRI